MAEIVVSVVLEIAKCLVPSTRSKISHLRKYKTNFQNLEEEVENLKDTSASIQHKIDEAKRKGEEIEEKVQKWLEKANEIIQEEAVKFPEDEETATTKRCFKGLCADLKTRYQLSKEAMKKLEDVVKHREAGSFDTISYCTSPKDPRLSNKNYMGFESRESTLNDILSAISNPDFNIIGIYGMGGVGKTTLAKEVAKKAEGNKLFDRVVFAVVNQSPEIEKIQGEIADRLGLTISDKETRSGRAGKLCERLKKEKNILVILDDIWASLDLEDVGIPLGDDHKGCKVLLTARSVEVLSGKMDSQRNFELRILNDKEAWNLFKRMAGNYIEGREFQSTAIAVAKKCAGLPIALVTVARALRNKKLFEWEYALQQLMRSSSENIEGIHATIELSYNHLESDELKETFLLIGYSFVKSIEVLLMYCMGLGLFEGINKMEEAQARIRTFVQKLKDSCMLLNSSIFGEDFSMHDVIRDVAISIASRKNQVLTVRNVPTDQWKWKDGSIVKSYSSVVFENVGSGHELLKALECPQYRFKSLIMRRIDCHSFTFPEDFFARMIELRVLDLSITRSRSLPRTIGLPPSIRLLTNLRALCLESFVNIDGLVVIGNLGKLEILRLKCTSFQQLPAEIGQLTRLKSLDLTGWVEVIPPNMLSRLSHLEELYLSNFDAWEVEGLSNKRRNASLDELNHLPYLTSLQIKIKDANTLPRDLSFLKSLERYEILVGIWKGFWRACKFAEIPRIFKLRSNIKANIWFDVWHIMELKKIEILFVEGLLDKKTFLYGLDNEGFSQLKFLEIQNSPNLRGIVECSININSAMIEFGQLRSLILKSLRQLTSFYSISTTDKQLTLFKEKVSIPYLQTLELDEINVERIWQNQVVALTCGIQKLTRLVIKRCSNLRCLFSSSMASSFDRLKHLEIWECLLVEEIVFLDDGLREEERKNTMFSQLEVLIIVGLENLTKFFSGEDHIEFLSLKKLDIKKCPKLKEFMVKNVSTNLIENPTPFFNQKVSLPNLETLELDEINVERIWQNQVVALSCGIPNLTRLVISSCSNLRCLFSSSMANSFDRLKHLEICKCRLVKEIVVLDDDGLREAARRNTMFSRLEVLIMEDLENLTKFFSDEDHIEFSSLKELKMRKCPKLKEFMVKNLNIFGDLAENQAPLINGKVAFSRFKKIEISGVDNLNLIVQHQFAHRVVFRKLKTMNIGSYDSLKFVTLCGMGSQLKRFHIGVCVAEEIVFVGNERAEQTNPIFVFPTVISLVLYDLPNFKNLFPIRKVFPNLKSLYVKGKSLETEIWQFSEVLCKLKCFIVDLDGATMVSSLDFLQRFLTMNKLIIDGNWHLKNVFHSGTEITVLKSNLKRCYDLKPILKEESSMDNLVDVMVMNCDNLINIVPSSISFQNLTTLVVRNCKGLENIFTFSTAMSLMRLRVMQIEKCNKIIEIVADEGHVAQDGIVFKELRKLSLTQLKSLESFCSGSYTFKFPALNELFLRDCPMMKTFPGRELSTPNLLQVLQARKDKVGCWKDNPNTTIQHLLEERVSIPYLQTLKLDEINIERIALSCGIQNLTRLVIRRCSNLRYLFSSSIASSFDRLKHLKICKCRLVEQVVFLDDDGLREAVRRNTMFSRLEVLIMKDLENLTKFFSGEDHIEFSSLKKLTIRKCPKLKEFMVKNLNIFGDLTENQAPLINGKVAFSRFKKIDISGVDNLNLIVQHQFAHQVVFRKLKSMMIGEYDLKAVILCGMDSQLKRFRIYGCVAEEIVFVGNEGAEQTNPIFVFPTVISLVLYDLPNFKNLFPIPKVFPNLESLYVKEKSIETVIRQYSEDFPCNLKSVILDLDGATTFSSLDFLQRSINMNKLVIDGNWDRKIVLHRETEMSETFIDHLDRCYDQKHILNEESSMDNLVDVMVMNCDNLINIVPSSISFQNLTTLVVRNCKGLENTFTFSTAVSLMRLRKMQISQCNKIIEIVADEGDVAQDGIVFKELKKLSLTQLKNLTSFCSGSYTLKFPALDELFVRDCPMMKTFSGGELSTPNLHQVLQHRMDKVGCWKGNLNTTIQHLHEEREKDKEESNTWADVNVSDSEEDAAGSSMEMDEGEYYSTSSDEWVSAEEEDVEDGGNEEVRSCKEDSGQPSTPHP